jgi:hypothetical protein
MSLSQKLPWCSQIVLSEHFNLGKKKNLGAGDKSGWMLPSAWQGTFFTADDQYAVASSCRRNQLFPAHFLGCFLLTAFLHIFAYSMPLWNKLKVAETLSINHLRSPTVRIVVDTLQHLCHP